MMLSVFRFGEVMQNNVYDKPTHVYQEEDKQISHVKQEALWFQSEEKTLVKWTAENWEASRRNRSREGCNQEKMWEASLHNELM